jgi:hypothetical protein
MTVAMNEPGLQLCSTNEKQTLKMVQAGGEEAPKSRHFQLSAQTIAKMFTALNLCSDTADDSDI